MFEELGGYQGGAIVTHGDTHSPETWTEHLLSELVPTPYNATDTTLVKISAAKSKLRPDVVAIVEIVRNAEREANAKFNHEETARMTACYNYMHGAENDPQFFSMLHHNITSLRSSANWADMFVNRLCKKADDIAGNIGRSNSMYDEVYRILNKWLDSVQQVERSHFVTHNGHHLTLV